MLDVGALPTLYDSQIHQDDTGPAYQPGTIFAWRGGTGRKQWSLVRYVLLDNSGCSQGEALVTNLGTSVEYGLSKAGTGDLGVLFRGVAAATIASNAYGFAIVAGYCGTADLSHTAASGEYLMVSGSTAGKLTPNLVSVHNAGYTGIAGSTASVLLPVAVARGAIATGLGSVQILGFWA